jgi:TatD DNase family protein
MRASAGSTATAICPGTDLATSRAAVATARRRPEVRATVGLHPHDAVRLREEWDDLVALCADPVVVAVGEAGLDHHYEHSPAPDQAAAFRAQIRLAHERGLPLVIHTREAWDETFAILDADGLPDRTVFHCFTGGPDEARTGLDLGIRISFSGIITFKTADDLRAAAAVCPLDRLLVETDAPYLAPVPHRGQKNRPALVPLVGAAVAEAKGVDVAAVAAASWQAATDLYRLAAAM